MKSIRSIGQEIYNMNYWRERRRYYIFLMRCFFNKKRIQEIDDFFHRNKTLEEIALLYPFVYEQPTRAFFYNKSTFEERAALVEQHMDFFTKHFPQEICRDLYSEKNIFLWDGGEVDGECLWAMLYYEAGQRKEGMMSVMLRLDNKPLYQIIFWISPDKKGDISMFIGAMQGPNMDGARDVVKKVTKYCHAYRTKNLILYITQAMARALNLKHIYAVTNEGYYANNHVRMDRKLKTDFSEFWIEAGGHQTEDSRFFELPLTESRKTIEEVPTRKRAVYRKRFAMLDEIDTEVENNIRKLMGDTDENG